MRLRSIPKQFTPQVKCLLFPDLFTTAIYLQTCCIRAILSVGSPTVSPDTESITLSQDCNIKKIFF